MPMPVAPLTCSVKEDAMAVPPSLFTTCFITWRVAVEGGGGGDTGHVGAVMVIYLKMIGFVVIFQSNAKALPTHFVPPPTVMSELAAPAGSMTVPTNFVSEPSAVATNGVGICGVQNTSQGDAPSVVVATDKSEVVSVPVGRKI